MNVHGSGQELPPLSVLVVDDNDVNQLYLRHLLRKMGHAPVEARDGREALAAVASQAFDLILMDIQLPDMDGLTLTRTIRAGQAGTANPADIPILAITAFATSADRVRCREAGMNDHLPKPLRASDLRAAMARYAVADDHGGAACSNVLAAPFDLAAFTRESSREFATEMLALFLELAEPKGLALGAALTRGDIPAAVALAHDLAGMAGPIRAERLHETMKAVQEACLAGDLSACRASHAPAESELTSVLAAVRAHPYLTPKDS